MENNTTARWRHAIALLLAAALTPPTLAAQSPGDSGEKPANEDIEEVLVEGSNRSLADELAAAARIPGGVTVIDTDELRQRSLVNLSDALRYVPGVWSASASGGQSVFYSSRGSNLDATDYDDNGIKLLQDGLPVTTADGNNHNRTIDPLAARSATVARGANAMAFGASTLGGAINFTSPTARDMSGPLLRLNGGAHDLATARGTVAGVAGPVDGLLTLESYTWGGYREHNEEDRTGAYGNAGWQIDDRLATRFYGTWLENDQELPGALTREQFERDPDQANPGAVGGNFQLNVDTWRVANRTSWQPRTGQRWEFGVSLEEQTLYHPIVDKVLVDFDGPGPMPPTEVFSLLIDTDHRDIGSMLRFEQSFDAHELLLGANYGRNDVDGGHYRNDGGERNGLTTLIDNEAESLEAFVQDRWRLSDALELTLALQGVWAERATRAEDVESGAVTRPDGSYDALNPRLGAVWNLTPQAALYANVSRLFEPPTNFELQDDVRGTDEPLDAMHGEVFEVGTRGVLDLGAQESFHWDVALYYADVRDEILSRDDPAAPGTSLATNVDKTVHAGIEALVGGRFALGESGRLALEPTFSVTLNDFRFDDDTVYGDNELPAAPDYAVRGEFMLRHASGLYAGPVFDLVGERWADFTNTYRVDDYQLLGARAGFEGRNWRVFVEGVNLLDTQYVATLSVRDTAARDAAILQPGQPLSVYAGVEFTF